MKVVFIMDQMYLHGGIERILSIKANYLSEQNDFEVHIITSEQKKKESCYPLNDSVYLSDININYNRLKSYFHPINLLKLPRHFFLLRNKLKKINPDIVVVCNHSTDTYFIPFLLKKIPKVKEFHFSKSIEEVHRKNSKSKKKYFLKFADYVQSKYDQLVVLNPDEAAYYHSNNVTIIPNPLTFFPEKVSELKKPVAIAAGRIAPVKAYDVLIDIWKVVFLQNKEWELHIYGPGDVEYINYLQKKIDDNGLSKNVFLKGKTNRIQSKMYNSSFFLMSSLNECFPLVLLEAQACGLPIISFDCPHGPKNIISNLNGMLIPMGDNLSFSQAIIELILDYDLRIKMGGNARKNSINYDIHTIMTQWEDMFNRLIKAKNS